MPKHALEALVKSLRSLLDDEPKPNLYIGEAMSCWTYREMLEEAVALEGISLNSTKDLELINVIEKCRSAVQSQLKRLEEFMEKEGVPFQASSNGKPKSNPEEIPAGAKMTENELTHLIIVKLSTSITFCASSCAECVRTDVGKMFLEFQIEAITYAALLKPIIKKKGFLKYPPKYISSGFQS